MKNPLYQKLPGGLKGFLGLAGWMFHSAGQGVVYVEAEDLQDIYSD